MKNTSVSRRSAVLMNRACMYSQQGGRVFTLRQVMEGGVSITHGFILIYLRPSWFYLPRYVGSFVKPPQW